MTRALLTTLVLGLHILLWSQPPTIVTDLHTHPEQLVMNIYNGIKTIGRYYTDTDFAKEVNTAVTLWIQDNANQDTVTKYYHKYLEDERYRWKVNDEIITQLSLFVLFKYAEVNTGRLPKGLTYEQRLDLAIAGISLGKKVKLVGKLEGITIKFTDGSRKWGMIHTLLNHTPKQLAYRVSHSKTLFLMSSVEYVEQQFMRFMRNTPKLLEKIDDIYIFEGKAMTPAGFERTYRMVVMKGGQVKTFYPIHDVKASLLNPKIYAEFLRIQSNKKPYLLNYE